MNDNGCEVVIPKIIWQTWKTHEVPEHWKPSVASITRYMPGWEHIIMSDEDNRKFVQQWFPDFLPYYDEFPHNIQRADAIRPLLLYVHGGIYMDLDIELIAPLDNLFYEDAEIFLVRSSNLSKYVTNCFMGSKPGCTFWLDCVEEMKKGSPWWAKIERHVDILMSTGPGMIDRVLHRNCSETVDGIIGDCSGRPGAGHCRYKLLPSASINPYSICDQQYNKEDALIRPLPGSSWVDTKGKVLQRGMCVWKDSNMAVALLIFILVVVVIISLRK